MLKIIAIMATVAMAQRGQALLCSNSIRLSVRPRMHKDRDELRENNATYIWHLGYNGEPTGNRVRSSPCRSNREPVGWESSAGIDPH
jgi:hypothetical protein